MTDILEIDSVQLSYEHRKILQGIYLKAQTGRVTAILGRNGCGKSSLLKMLYGEISHSEKTIRVNQKALLSGCRDPFVMRMLPHLSFIPASFSLAQVFDDFELELRDFTSCFQEFEKRGNCKMEELSGGNIRTIEVYVILMSRTRFVLLDEPFTQVSPLHLEIFSGLIATEKSKKGIIITDHDYRTVLSLSDDLYLLRDGTTYRVNGREDLVRYGYLPDKN